MNFKISSITPISTAASISLGRIYAMSALVNVAVIRQLRALLGLRVRESGFIIAVVSCTGSQ